jgi:CRP-like cAMP-binding protein
MVEESMEKSVKAARAGASTERNTEHINPLPILARAPIFQGLDTAALQTILQASRRRQVKANTFFFHEGEPATLFYVLLEGRARLTQVTAEGHQVIVHYVGPGDGIGIIVALSSMAYPVSAEAVEDCLALSWDTETILQLMLENPRLALNGMKLIAHRFAELQDRYRELATERVERRVARALLRLVRQAGKRVEGGVLIDMPLSRQDLAEMTGTTLYTVSRILSNWEERGLVDGGRERVVLRNSHELVIIAEDLPQLQK